MILVDTSIWIDHLRRGDAALVVMLQSNRVLTHPFVIGELACGNLSNREAVLALLGKLPRVVVAADEEVLEFIDRHRLMGRGLGYVDMHLLAAARLSPPVTLWTRDQRFAEVAAELSVSQ